MKIIPARLHNRISQSPGLRKILDNIGWLFFDKALRLGVGLIVGVWVARYLGPEQFGQLNFAMAFVSLFGAVATLGLNGIVVRDLVKDRQNAYTTLGTAFLLSIGGAIAALFLMLTIVTFIRPDDLLTRAMITILGLAMIFQSSAVIRYWFESQVQSRYVVWSSNTVFLLIAAVKVGMILMQAPLIAFVWIVFVEAALTAIALFVIYLKKEKSLRHWSWQLQRAKSLLTDSWPLILSGIAIMIYMRIDQIMLGQMIGAQAVGIYSAALRISEVWYMIPMIIVSSLFPSVIESRENDRDLYNRRMQSLLNLMATVAIAIALLITFIGDWLIAFLFGQEYAGASSVLKIHIWSGVFVFVGVAGSNWYLVENLQRLSLYRTLAGALINILLNLLLIPIAGIIGAAIATVISQFFSAYLLDCSSSRSQFLFTAKTLAIIKGPYLLLKRS